ncbi:hypothetical protein PR202_ga12278 [Eleusine coracana subsp. coracana]|uniref:Uncharacterized protein n=1 Tax=Eleusine coracana subsp. coracana TaxID=191504 RepID=A0AAV5CBV2_ELECO|nr:hypothetical protein PR202_ga12278 [Eleusine coracana subsp. coracana]
MMSDPSPVVTVHELSHRAVHRPTPDPLLVARSPAQHAKPCRCCPPPDPSQLLKDGFDRCRPPRGGWRGRRPRGRGGGGSRERCPRGQKGEAEGGEGCVWERRRPEEEKKL